MDNCILMDDFNIELSLDEVIAKLCISEDEDIALMDGKLKEALAIARPKAVYRPCAVDKIEGSQVTIEGCEFESEILAQKLAGIHHVFAFVVTCGTEVDEWSKKEDDYIVNLWLDMLKEMILSKTRKQFYSRLLEQYKLEKISSMSPGSGNLDTWPIAQQKPLFALIGSVTETTGVRLTEDCLMLPTKSVSGVIFPSDKSFITCTLCRRKNCVERKAPYQGEA